jgi:hypothetical protein
MKHSLIFAGIGIVGIVAGVVYIIGGTDDVVVQEGGGSEVATQQTHDTQVVPGGVSEVDVTLCDLQANGAYVCSQDAVKDFGPITVATTGSEATCTVSYGANGLVFESGDVSATIPRGEFAVALYNDGSVANIVRSAGQSVSIHVGSSGKVDQTMLVNTDYSSVMCFDTNNS